MHANLLIATLALILSSLGPSLGSLGQKAEDHPPQIAHEPTARVEAYGHIMRVVAVTEASDRIVYGLGTNKTYPKYPSEAVASGIAGTVVIQARVSATGEIIDAWVRCGVHESLDNSALESAWKWRFKPTTVNDKPADAEAEIVISFVPR